MAKPCVVPSKKQYVVIGACPLGKFLKVYIDFGAFWLNRRSFMPNLYTTKVVRGGDSKPLSDCDCCNKLAAVNK